MQSHRETCVIGVDVGGTNTDAVLFQNNNVQAWSKTTTTHDFYEGISTAIARTLQQTKVTPGQVASVRIGTTQFVNAVLEQNASKLDKVAVIRLCGPYTRGSPPFVDFPPKLRCLIEGYIGYVQGGYQVHGEPISDLDPKELRAQANIIKSRGIKSIVVVGIYSPSVPDQEILACTILAETLGPRYDISCSHRVGRLGFLERENASILNASLRRFARNVVRGFRSALRGLSLIQSQLYITLNDGTLTTASAAADCPVRCFSSGPTNSVRGAILLASLDQSLDSESGEEGSEVLVVDVGGTSTDISALLASGYPKQSSAFVKIAGIRTNFTIPDVHSVAMGGGSIVKVSEDGEVSVGPKSVGSNLESEAFCFGGSTLTATDIVKLEPTANNWIGEAIKDAALDQIKTALERAIDLAKTRQGDATLLLVGGGSFLIPSRIEGAQKIIRPRYYEVANAVGAAIGKLSADIDMTVVPTEEITLQRLIDSAVNTAKEKCVAAGGDPLTLEVVEMETIPHSYVMNGATRVIVRVVGELIDGFRESSTEEDLDATGENSPSLTEVNFENESLGETIIGFPAVDPGIPVDVKSYRPQIKGNIWYLSKIDLDFLMDGTGVLGVGSCGEPYPSYLACLEILQHGGHIKIQEMSSIGDDETALVVGFMGSPAVYEERVPGLNEITESMRAVMEMTDIAHVQAVIPHEIGGLNAFESLLAASRYDTQVLDTDCVARAFPMVWQTVRSLNGVSVLPSALSDGELNIKISNQQAADNFEAENIMRAHCTERGSLAGMCVNPLNGAEAKASLPANSFSYAWTIGQRMALARQQKLDVVQSVLEIANGVLIFQGKIVSIERTVDGGFTRGKVTIEASNTSEPYPSHLSYSTAIVEKKSLTVEFENENLIAVEHISGKESKVVACCPDLITFLDLANAAPLGTSSYKYGLRVSVIALAVPPIWTTEIGLKYGGPRAFDLDIEYKNLGIDGARYQPPKSVFELFRPDMEKTSILL